MSRVITYGSQYRTHAGRALRPASTEHRQRKAMQRQARYSGHLLPEANKYRGAAFYEMQTAHRFISRYRQDKDRIALIEANGPRHVADRSFQSQLLRAGGAAAYLKDLLSAARYYLASAASFQRNAPGVVLP